MNFSQALVNLKEGRQVQRSGWNGKNMFIYLVDRSDVPDYCSFLEMYTADRKRVPWLASQTDILAEDWEIVGQSGTLTSN